MLFESSPRLLGIDVHRDRDLAERSVPDGGAHSVANRLDRRVAALGLDQQAAPVLATEPEERRRAEQVVGGAETIGDQVVNLPGRGFDPCLILAGEPDLDQM
jgi:hypothetical protein